MKAEHVNNKSVFAKLAFEVFDLNNYETTEGQKNNNK